MRLSHICWRILLVLLAPSLASTIILYLYPAVLGCHFPSPPSRTTQQGGPGYDTSVAPFRLLVLADPQLEGDSSLPDPDEPLLPSVRRFLSSFDARKSSIFDVRKLLTAVVTEDIPELFSSTRKRIDLVGNDYYLAHIYRTLHWYTEPTHVTVLGDLLGSQWISDDEFEHRGWRYWERVFRHGRRVKDEITKDVPGGHREVLGDDQGWSRRIINIAGNHDVGYAGDLSDQRIDRFERTFGRSNWDVTFTLSIPNTSTNETSPMSSDVDEHISDPKPSIRLLILNDMNLDGPALSSSQQQQTYSHINDQFIARAAPVEDASTFTILLTHVPLHKPKGVCVDPPFFSFFPSHDPASQKSKDTTDKTDETTETEASGEEEVEVAAVTQSPQEDSALNEEYASEDGGADSVTFEKEEDASSNVDYPKPQGISSLNEAYQEWTPRQAIEQDILADSSAEHDVAEVDIPVVQQGAPAEAGPVVEHTEQQKFYNEESDSNQPHVTEHTADDEDVVVIVQHESEELIESPALSTTTTTTDNDYHKQEPQTVLPEHKEVNENATSSPDTTPSAVPSQRPKPNKRATYHPILPAGLREQNHLSVDSTRNILAGIFGMSATGARKGLILTGHDHEGCDVVHYPIPPSAQPDAQDSAAESDQAMPQDLPQTSHEEGFSVVRSPDFPNSSPPSGPFLREITLRSMMGSYQGNAGLLSLWYNHDQGQWEYGFQTCALGVQHWWWAVHVLDLVVFVVTVIGVVAWMVEGGDGVKRGKLSESAKAIDVPTKKAMQVQNGTGYRPTRGSSGKVTKSR